MVIVKASTATKQDWLQSALDDIGLATIVTDAEGRIVETSDSAELLTAWPMAEALGKPVAEVFRIQTEVTRQVIANPVGDVLANQNSLGFAEHMVLITRDGRERRVDYGVAPRLDSTGTVIGASIVFSDVSEKQRLLQGIEDAREFADGILQTVQAPLIVLNADLVVLSANAAFYDMFHTTPELMEGQSFLTCGGKQWDIYPLPEALGQILPQHGQFDGVVITGEFCGLGQRIMLLTGRRLCLGRRPPLILLTIEDATERKQVAARLELSEIRYRRLFETAQVGIMLIAPETQRIIDANPFLANLIGCSHAELIEKELWQIGLFKDITSSQTAFRTLQEHQYLRYDELPLRTQHGTTITVEFISNVYLVGDKHVIQCNIRDVTAQKQGQAALQAAHNELEERITSRTAELATTNKSLSEEIVRRKSAETERRALQQKLTTAQEDERRRMARELHDQLGQHLTAISLGLKVIQNGVPHLSPESKHLELLQSLTSQIGREVHRLALDLRPTVLDDIGIQAAIGHYAESWSERTGIEVDYHTIGFEEGRLPAPLETALYRIIQEALTNILKHAKANRVSIIFHRTNRTVTAIVEDNGQGFAVDSIAGDRLGILGMRERANLVGGSLEVESSAQQGTTVIVHLPIETNPLVVT